MAQKGDAYLLNMEECPSCLISFSCCLKVTQGHSISQKKVNWLLTLLYMASKGFICLGHSFVWFLQIGELYCSNLPLAVIAYYQR